MNLLLRWAKFVSIPDNHNGCWLWIGAVGADGYGLLTIRSGHTRKTYRASRLAYELFRGPLYNRLHALHRCDTPLCVNPDHLFKGTPTENMSDAKAKGRLAKGVVRCSRDMCGRFSASMVPS